MNNKSLILASASKRRQDIFNLMGLDFKIEISQADEHIPPCSPEQFVMELARKKAKSVHEKHKGEDICVVGADTIVSADGKIIGKPHDRLDAFRILRELSGRTHTVFTGVAVITDSEERVFYDSTVVTFEELSDEEINAYIETGEPFDKAGAYGVQGAACTFVKKVDGNFFNVIGLPAPKVYKALKELGVLWL